MAPPTDPPNPTGLRELGLTKVALAIVCVLIGCAAAFIVRETMMPNSIGEVSSPWKRLLPDVCSELERMGFADAHTWWVSSAYALISVPGDKGHGAEGSRIVDIPMPVAEAFDGSREDEDSKHAAGWLWPLYRGLQGTRFANDRLCFSELKAGGYWEWNEREDWCEFLLLTLAFPIMGRDETMPPLEEVWSSVGDSGAQVPEVVLQRALAQAVVLLNSRSLPTARPSEGTTESGETWAAAIAATDFLGAVAKICAAQYPESQWWKRSALITERLDASAAHVR